MAISYPNRTSIKPPAAGFGALLRHWRETRGLSTMRLALRADLDQSSISRYESGGRTPTRETVVRLADALDLDGTHRIAFLGAACYLARPLTDAQVMALDAHAD